MLETVRRTVEGLGVVRPGSGILVAVSGGPDSLALLECLVALAPEWGVRLEVAHVDHGLRPEAAADAGFVRDRAGGLGLAFHLGHVDAGSASGRLGTSVQDAAHRLRMEYLEETRVRRGLDWIATGHHLDDQAETVLLHFLRGAGPDGLAGLRVLDGRTVRPLLEIRRSEIEEFCRERGLTPRIDPSNVERKYLRNVVRLDVLPYLADKINPSLAESLAGSARFMADVSDLLSDLGRDAWTACVLEHDPITLSVDGFRALHPALQREVIRICHARVAGSPRDLGRKHVESARRLWLEGRDGSWVELPSGVRAWIETGHLVMGPEDTRRERFAPTPGYEYRLDVPGRVAIPEAGIQIEAVVMGRGEMPPKALKPGSDGAAECPGTGGTVGVPLLAHEVYIDYNKIDLPLAVRNRRPGDRFRPLNMGGSQKVKDFFIAGKIPPGIRDLIPLVCTGRRLVWVVGQRLDERFKIDEETTSVVRLRATEHTGV